MSKRIVSLAYTVCMVFALSAQSPVVYDFKSTSDTSGAYSGTLQNGATLTTLGTYGVLSLGANDGYFNLGAQFGSMMQELGSSFTISVDIFVPTSSDISANGNFIWCFSKSSTEGYMFLNAKDMRYAITQSSWSSETSVNAAETLPEGEWVNIIYVQDGATGTVYLNNVQKAQNSSMTLFPSTLSLQNNYLGRSCYNGDAYLKDARYADLRVYNTALGSSDRAALVNTIDVLNRLENGIETEADAVAADMAAVYVPMVAYKKINLPTEGRYGTQISWSSGDPSLLTADGTVVRQIAREVGVSLIATFTLGDVTQTKNYAVNVMPKEEYSHYLFAFFPSNSDENIYFALSADGYNYTTINNNEPVFRAEGNTVMGGLRDPHILRGGDGCYYMVATDMRSNLGWNSNRGIVMMKSNDLINWTCSQVHFPTKYAGTYLENVTRVWAPETIFDHRSCKYMVYFSILTDDGTVTYDKVYYAYANSDFTDLEGEPVYLYDRGSATIDMDIVYNEGDGLYHGFYKNEGSGGICKVTAESLTADGTPGSQWSTPSSTLQQTNEAVEGAGVFRLINDDQWILMYDCYNNGHYQFCSSRDLTNFTFVKNTETGGTFTPRHGTVLPITEEQYQALLNAFPCETLTGETKPNENGNLNLTAEYIPQLCESNDHWTDRSGFSKFATTANYSNANARVSDTFMERWRDHASIGANLASKTLRYLPAGTYKFSGSFIASWQYDTSVTVSGVTCFADDQTADVHTSDGVPELYTLTFDIQSAADYTTTLGVQTSAETNANWVAFDSFRLYYVGTEDEYHAALRAMHDDYIAHAEAVYTQLYTIYQPELRAVIDAVNPDETDYRYIVAQLDALQAAIAMAQQRIDGTLLLYDDDSSQPSGSTNADIISAAANIGTQYSVVLIDHTLKKDGCWNTLCLPFSLTIDGTPLDGADVRMLDSGSPDNGTLTLNFETANTIEAGKPYIIKWHEGQEDLVNPVFTNVTISNIVPTSVSFDGGQFVGTYSSIPFTEENKSILFLGDENLLYYPKNGASIGACHAYFELSDSSISIKSFVLNFDDNVTGITERNINNDDDHLSSGKSWYDLSGRRFYGKPKTCGIYIRDGRKLVINQ